MTYDISQNEYLIAKTAVDIFRQNFATELAAAALVNASYDFAAPDDESIEIGDMDGVRPVYYPCIRNVVGSSSYSAPESDGIVKVRSRLIVRGYVQSFKSDDTLTGVSKLVADTINFTSLLRKIIERDLTEANGALGVYRVRTVGINRREPYEEGQSGLVAVGEISFDVFQEQSRY